MAVLASDTEQERKCNLWYKSLALFFPSKMVHLFTWWHTLTQKDDDHSLFISIWQYLHYTMKGWLTANSFWWYCMIDPSALTGESIAIREMKVLGLQPSTGKTLTATDTAVWSCIYCGESKMTWSSTIKTLWTTQWQ